MATDAHPSWSLGRPQNGPWASHLAKVMGEASGTVTLGPGLGHLLGAVIPHPSLHHLPPRPGPPHSPVSAWHPLVLI